MDLFLPKHFLDLIHLKPRERFELPCNGSAVHRFASKLPWHYKNNIGEFSI